MEHDLPMLVLALGIGVVALLSLASAELLYAGVLCCLLVVLLVLRPGDGRHRWFATLCVGELVVVAVAGAGRWEALVVQFLVLGMLLRMTVSPRTVREYAHLVVFSILASAFVLYADWLFHAAPVLLQLGAGCMILIGVSRLYEYLLNWRWTGDGA
ncbi:MAG: hypothetical protein PHT74_00070 [Methanoculleus horonobensis]|nr:hypothetical protein [Methanoculleus horonobensis]